MTCSQGLRGTLQQQLKLTQSTQSRIKAGFDFGLGGERRVTINREMTLMFLRPCSLETKVLTIHSLEDF